MDVGIIPAYAGSTDGLPIAEWRRADHPRIRGEHPKRGVWPVGADGSSPHTRGAPIAEVDPESLTRIIPAYAGSTRAAAGTGIEHWDHPRIRGEHRRFSSPSLAIDGSSPHTRGAPERGSEKKSGCRIIPAYAGSTWSRSTCRPSPRDHPRIRGEHMPLTRVRTMSSGSSPHTRGARLADFPELRPERIIPAYAGSTSKSSPRTLPVKDHPRIRGEHAWPTFPSSDRNGSSPHTRGAHPKAVRGLYR